MKSWIKRRGGGYIADLTGSLWQGPTRQVAEVHASDTETERTVIHHRGNSACQHSRPGDDKRRCRGRWEGKNAQPEEPRSDKETRQQPDLQWHTHTHTHKLNVGLKCVLTGGLGCPYVHTEDRLSGRSRYNPSIITLPPVSETSTQTVVDVHLTQGGFSASLLCVLSRNTITWRQKKDQEHASICADLC